MAKKFIKGIVSRSKNHDSEVFVILRGKHYTIPGNYIDEEKPDISLRTTALNNAYKPYGFEIKTLGNVRASRHVGTLEYGDVEEIYHEVLDWEKIKPRKEAKSSRRGRVKWVPSNEIYDILDSF